MTSDGRKVRTFVPYGDMMVELPDYGEEPETGSCWNCNHMVIVTIGGKDYELCVSGRDLRASGDVDQISADTRDCPEWEEW